MEIPTDLMSLIHHSREERFLEYKRSAPWEELRLKVARSAMGMANITDGGTIIIGVAERDGGFIQEGVLDEHLSTYDGDEVQAYVNSFADPYVRLELHHVPDEGRTFVAIVVYEFDQIPVVCKRASGDLLRQGAIYTRSHRIPETCEVPTQTEMREITELATDKGIRRFITRLHRVGIPVEETAMRSDEETFAKQLEGM